VLDQIASIPFEDIGTDLSASMASLRTMLSSLEQSNTAGKIDGAVSNPGYLENSSVVSRSTEQRLFISGRHAWAESLDRAATRAIVGNLNQLLPNSEVLGYPWDVRTKPRYALRIDLVQFDGVRGGSVAIQGRWSLYDLQDKLEAKSGFINESVSLTSRDYQSYVAALNKLLGEFSTSVAADLVD